MSRYANNDMHSVPNRQPSSDDRKRGSGHYAQMYESPDQIGGQHSPPRNTGRAIEVPISQPGQHQQRMVPVGASRPPVANAIVPNRGSGSAGPRPLSYTKPPSEERSDAANQRQEKRRGYRRTEDPGEDWEQTGAILQPNSRPGAIQTSSFGTSSIPNQALPTSRDRVNASGPIQTRQEPQAQKPISPIKPKDALASGAVIPRLNSPSVMSSVLQPLDKKVQEYDSQMKQAEQQMAQLDADMAALQERRKEAERRFAAAKGKHDDYRRQYQGVERAMRGEPEPFSRSSFDDAESVRSSTQQTLQQPVQDQKPLSPRTDSWSSIKKSKNDSRFRLSKLFGSS